MERQYRSSNSTQQINQTNFSLKIKQNIDSGLYCLDYEEFTSFYKKIKPDSEDIVLLDTRPDDEINSGIISNSVLANSNFVLNKLISNKNTKVLLICEEGYEEDTIKRLFSLGFKNIIGYLDGGIDTWINRKQMLVLPKFIEKTEAFHQLDSIIDCREPREWNYGVLSCKDIVLMPIDQVSKKHFMLDNNKKYGVYCKRGMRSLAVTTFLMSKGFDISNIPGGFINWVFKSGKGKLVKKLLK